MWGSEPATDKQKATLEKLGVPIKEGLTKYEAAVLLDEALKRNPESGVLSVVAKKVVEKEVGKDGQSPPKKSAREGDPPEGKPLEPEAPDKIRLQVPKSTTSVERPSKSSSLPRWLIAIAVIAVTDGVLVHRMLDSTAPQGETVTEPSEPAVTNQGFIPFETNTSPVAPLPPAMKPEVQNYANGRVREQGSLRQQADGSWVKHGIWTNYWANGNINTWGEYQDGEKVGAWPFWMEDGKQLSTNRFRAKKL